MSEENKPEEDRVRISTLERELEEARREAKTKNAMFLIEAAKHSEWLEKYMVQRRRAEAAEALTRSQP
jgi:hypothetical protein